MLDETEYRKVIIFQQENSKTYLDEVLDEHYAQKLLNLLDKILGFKYSFHGYLGNLESKTLSPNGTIHSLDVKFVQHFLIKMWEQPQLLEGSSNLFLLSRLSNYKKNPIYKNVLKSCGFTDCLIMFVQRSKGNFMSYIVIFKKEQPFTESEVEMLKLVEKDILICYENFLKGWNMRNDINMLMSCTNYFPMGIMIVENTNTVTFANPLAKEYLATLGYTDSRFYSTFYINELYKYIQYELTNFGTTKPIRVKNFLFSLQPIGNPGTNFSQAGRPLLRNSLILQEQSKHDIHYSDMSLCIYIVKDDNYNSRVSKKTLQNQGLTNRECQVAEYIINGASNQDIANELFLSTNTVKIHVSNIFNKIGVNSRTELIEYFYGLERNN